jgi:cardiolipin synthase
MPSPVDPRQRTLEIIVTTTETNPAPQHHQPAEHRCGNHPVDHGAQRGRRRHHIVLASIFATATAGLLLAGCHVPNSLTSSSTGTGGSGTAAQTPAGTDVNGPVLVEPQEKWADVYSFITSAHSRLDMTMYELVDTTAEQDLIADAQRGVTVRVILDQNLERKNNQAAYDLLASHGVQVHWAPSGFRATHQKTISVDSTRSMILTGNLTSRYYSTTRDFGLEDTDAPDVAAIEQVFQADFSGQTITPPVGDDLVWSPTNSQTSLLGLINAATTSLAVENEEMSDKAVIRALVAAAHRGVQVSVTMTKDSSWASAFSTLVAAGVRVSTYPDTASALYIHAKIIVIDAGHPDARAFLGSENFSVASLTGNRELGLLTSTPAEVDQLATVLSEDFSGATPWQ